MIYQDIGIIPQSNCLKCGIMPRFHDLTAAPKHHHNSITIRCHSADCCLSLGRLWL